MSTIMIIDDNEDFRQTLKELLEAEGYAVVEAADGRKGIDLYRKAPVDLVVTDIIMPNKEGIETIVELRRDYPGVKIFAISGGGRSLPELYLMAAQSWGALQSFKKPLDRVEFLGAVRRVLAGE